MGVAGRELSAVRLFTAVRLAYWLAAAATLLWAPLTHDLPPFRAYGGASDTLFDAFAQWDAQWFIHVADHGYDSQQVTAFFPLYPLLVAALAVVVRSTVVAAVLLSLAAGIAAAELLLRVARPLVGDRAAADAVLLLAVYPLAFVFTAAYSDGLFVALSLGAVLAAQRGSPLAAGVLGGLAVGTRLVGLALLPTLALLLRPRDSRGALRLAPLLLLPAAVGAYALYLDRHRGDAWAFVHAQGIYWHRHTPALGPLSGLWDAVQAGRRGAGELALHLPRAGTPLPLRDQWATWNVVHLVLLLAAFWLTWEAWRRLGAAYGLYSAATLAIVISSPAEIVPLVSLPRFLLADFPLLVALASVLAGRPRARAGVIGAFAALGGIAAAAFAHHVWIG